MQEIKTLMLRVGSKVNLDEFVFDGPMTDSHIQGYLNQGWTLFSVSPGSIDQGTSSVSTMYTLIREKAVDAEEYDTEASEWLDKVSRPLVSS